MLRSMLVVGLLFLAGCANQNSERTITVQYRVEGDKVGAYIKDGLGWKHLGYFYQEGAVESIDFLKEHKRIEE